MLRRKLERQLKPKLKLLRSNKLPMKRLWRKLLRSKLPKPKRRLIENWLPPLRNKRGNTEPLLPKWLR